MNRNEIKQAIEDAERFIDRAILLMRKHEEDRGSNDIDSRRVCGYPAQQGAVKRASMDLTRSLAKMRKA